ncbi:hypothetical protein IQ268_11120 [Oculatella sp. LEGE 06141]|uniref:hypothetical protein n=1 Tax=Oculatella sp. LEGE 06141 TaxID=1828648 RepID=UPI001880C2D1|nr:hypothetical protein [Oculatella sp. LEGE 06141]MBE9179112.1 hypothetical protein [Oculatella sp. LEGE 06141]
MVLELKPNQLLSRAIRWNSSKGITGSGVLGSLGDSKILNPDIRKINPIARIDSQTDEDGGFLGWLWDSAKTFIGFIGKIFGIAKFSLTAAWGWLSGRFEQIKAFNWNASDLQLQSMLDSQNVALASVWGSLIGQGIGWAAGIGVGYSIGFFCPVIGGSFLAKSIAGSVTTESIEELLPQLRSALGQTAGALANSFLISGYMQFRRLLKTAPRDLLESVFGEGTSDFIRRQWGAEGGPDYSFNATMDSAVQDIDNAIVQTFIENLLEESWDSFMESGFIIAQELDEAFQQTRVVQKEQFGPDKTLEIKPDVRSDEVLVFQDVPQKLLEPAVMGLINQQRLVHNRDMGSIISQPVDEYIRARPQLRKLVLLFKGRSRPPWKNPDGSRAKEVCCAIPDARRGLTWDEIKTAAQPFTWGRFKAVATLDNQRQMHVNAATKEMAENTLLRLAALSTAEILRLTVSEEERTPTPLRKTATDVYPAYATLMARTASLTTEGRTMLDGRTFTEEIKRFELWTNNPPLGWEGLP